MNNPLLCGLRLMCVQLNRCLRTCHGLTIEAILLASSWFSAFIMEL